MPTKIFVNLPVRDVARSQDFFGKMGYKFDPRFTDKNAACMVIAEDIYAMLVREEFFKQFTHKDIADASSVTETLVALSAESREQVDDIINRALDAGGTVFREAQDMGWMYSRSFEDPDGHIWEFVYMDMDAMPPGGPAAQSKKTKSDK